MTTQTPDAVREAVARIQKWMDDEHRDLSPGEVAAELSYDDVTTVLRAALDSRAGDAGEGAQAIYERAQRELGFSPRGKMGGLSERVTLHAIQIALSATPAHAVDAVPAGEDVNDWLRGDWYERWQDATENADEELMATLESLRGRVEQTIRAALSHGEGRK